MTNTNQPLPQHIAIIMDGNGRWAKERNLKRTAGHEQGAKTVQEITKFCNQLNIKYLTLYAFSTENWNRPKLEVEFLMRLLHNWLEKQLNVYLENNVRFKAIGDISKFSSKLQSTINEVEIKTANCTGLTQILALNYGSRDEMVRAAKKVVEKNLEINEQNITLHLDTAGIPDVDLLVRTSGEIRISNFLLWQCAYAEMFFTQTYWPDFTANELDDIISDFGSRHRRFGGV